MHFNNGISSSLLNQKEKIRFISDTSVIFLENSFQEQLLKVDKGKTFQISQTITKQHVYIY